MPKKSQIIKYTEGIGKRKSAIARVRLFNVEQGGFITIEGMKIKAGEILVNKKPIEKIYVSEVAKKIYLKPLVKTGTIDKVAVSVHLKGGGFKGQVEAIAHGISKALLKVDENKYRPLLKVEGLLKRDPRIKERRKVGTGGKARRKKQSPKR